jgi:hypothetical protein
MITAIVQYRLPPSIDLKACAEHFRKIAPGLPNRRFDHAGSRMVRGWSLYRGDV